MKKLNKDIYDKAKALNEWILSTEEVKEFQRLEKYIKEHDELNVLENSLKVMQQEIVNRKHQGDDCQELIEEYQVLMDSFSNHPIVYNYLTLKNEVNELLLSIEDDIKKQLAKNVDCDKKIL